MDEDSVELELDGEDPEIENFGEIFPESPRTVIDIYSYGSSKEDTRRRTRNNIIISRLNIRDDDVNVTDSDIKASSQRIICNID